MPYCPKCDMEFVDGITTCSDCGGPLVESEEAYKKEMKKKMERAYQKRMEEARQYYQADELIQREVPLEKAREGRIPDPDEVAVPTFTLDYSAPDPQPKRRSVPTWEEAMKNTSPRSFTSEEMKEQRAAAADRYAQALRMAEAQRLLGHYTGAARRPAQEQPATAPSASNRGMAPNPAQNPSQKPEGSGQPAAVQPRMTTGSGVYVSSRQKGEDRRSSSMAFALVGGIITLFSLACWVGLFRLPMTGTSLYFFQGILTVMGLGFLFVAVRSLSSVKELAKEAEAEEQRTKEIIQWFKDSWTGDDLDKALLSMENGLEVQELQLRRYALIQYRLITGQNLTDQPYIDYLADEIYAALYPDEEDSYEEEEDSYEDPEEEDYEEGEEE
ncbi:MAG: hypothetical protein SPF91_04895 [Clostridium sp.]|nr:hypothetical protein [Clostridium sp.]MDY5483517.1 hypothetical protein [Clostridium sp.]